MTQPTNERNAAFDAVKAAVLSMIKSQAGMFAGAVEADITTTELLAISDAALNAAAAVRAAAKPATGPTGATGAVGSTGAK
jgi:hypothetical protein